MGGYLVTSLSTVLTQALLLVLTPPPTSPLVGILALRPGSSHASYLLWLRLVAVSVYAGIFCDVVFLVYLDLHCLLMGTPKGHLLFPTVVLVNACAPAYIVLGHTRR